MVSLPSSVVSLPSSVVSLPSSMRHPAGMMVVTEAEAAAIRAAFEQRGEFSAAVELRRLFPAVTRHRAGPRLCPDHCRLEAPARAAAPGAAGTPEKTRYRPTCLIVALTTAARNSFVTGDRHRAASPAGPTGRCS
jgi:hypothetical protein